MSDISSTFLNFEATNLKNNKISFNKKNAWKNEWEKAQKDNANKFLNNEKSDIKQKNKPEVQESKLENKSTQNYSHIYDQKIVSRHNDIILSVNNKQGVSPKITNKNNTYYSAISDTQPLSVSYRSEVSPLNINKYDDSTIIINNTYLNKISDKTKLKYKLQNISLSISENGVKLYIRDYRLDKSELNVIIKNIKNYLNEFGIEIYQVIINGSGFNDENV